VIIIPKRHMIFCRSWSRFNLGNQKAFPLRVNPMDGIR